ncbi:hypothetical protein AAFF_G00355980 [Aldrovandia affinis]|uniref:Uncharacterized protein n=1 Tax=Aldrovandia affinis TaxID=143900 RepID=A0AAD7VZH1_9TELE|nr:hypothetical protein AAFF_G00355980 [Aldrovandia affinis]
MTRFAIEKVPSITTCLTFHLVTLHLTSLIPLTPFPPKTKGSKKVRHDSSPSSPPRRIHISSSVLKKGPKDPCGRLWVVRSV